MVCAAVSDGSTALILACQNGHEACARLLIDAKAAVDAALTGGLTGLMLARQNGHEACARLLIDAGARTDL